jgi:hypothetical protein
VTKRTPFQKLQQLRKDGSAAIEAEYEKTFADAEHTLTAASDPNLSFNQRLKIYSKLQAFPRIVLGLYRAELAVAQKDGGLGGPTLCRARSMPLPSRLAHRSARLALAAKSATYPRPAAGLAQFRLLQHPSS